MSISALHHFIPTITQLLGFIALAATAFTFAAIGAAVGGTRRFAAVDVFVGWGAVTSIFVISGVLARFDFSWLVYGFFALSLPLAWYAIRRDRDSKLKINDATTLWRVLILAAPFFLIILAMRASQWDEFSHWLPNAQFLFRYNMFPYADLPNSASSLPGYPYGLPLVTYLTSKLAGQFVENTSTLFNLLLIFFYAVVLANVITIALKRDDSFRRNLSVLAVCMLGVTILSTTFVQKIILTSYADSTTSVTLAVVAVLVWKIVNKLAGDSKSLSTAEDINNLSWQCGFAIAIFIFLKQTNLVLLALLLAGFSVVVVRDPAIRVKDALHLLPRLLLPGVVVYLAWRYHVGHHIPQGEFSFLSVDQWHLAEAGAILLKMITVASKKAPFFIMMLAIALYAIRSLVKFNGSRDRLLIPIAIVFLGFNLFLWLIYITAFGRFDALRVASFWRYNMQMGLLGATGAAYGLALVWQKYVVPYLAKRPSFAKSMSVLPIVLVLILPLALQHKIRFDMRPQKDHMRAVGQELATTLPDNASLAVIDLNSDGFTGTVIGYELTAGLGAGRGIKVPLRLSAYNRIKSTGQLIGLLNKTAVTHAWVHQPVPIIEATLKIRLAPYASHLLKRQNGKWLIVKSWPYDGYKDPHSLPD